MDIEDDAEGISRIRRDSSSRLILKSALWPLFQCREALVGSQYIEREIGKWIRELSDKRTTFLDVGCGSMRLMKYLSPDIYYNGFDISFSEFHLRRNLRKGRLINIAVASATEIPLESDSVNLIASTEVFEHIPEIGRAIQKIHRVATSGANLICSIPNNSCYKYKKKGPHPDHVNNWSYSEFIEFMENKGFELQRGYMKGWWVPLPLWLTKKSYHLPLSMRQEFKCTNFFYQFTARS